MNETSATAMLVGTRDMFAADSNAVTTTVPRDEIEAALTSEPPADLILEVLRTSPGSDDAERRTVNVGWTRTDLESVLANRDAQAITFSFDANELQRALDDPDVEGHGLREAAVVLSIAAAAAVGVSSAASAQSDPAGGSSSLHLVGGHDEAGLTARGIGIQPAAAVHNEATLAARGIETGTPAPLHDEESLTARGIVAQPAGPVHDEVSLTARGIEPGTPAAVHDEVSLTARGIEPGTLAAAHDEASLTARGIEPGTLAATHDEASLTARGIGPLTAVHDEASLTARGIEAQSSPAVHDEATLIARGIEQEPVVAGDTGSGFEFPSVDPATAAGIAGGLAGAGLLIAAAAFATRRREPGHV